MKLIFFLAFILIGSLSIAQQTAIDYVPANDGATFLTCDGFIIDSGGQGGNGYGNNENVTITICPDTITSGNNDDMISIVFNLFNLDTYDDNPAPNITNVDVVNIWDGVGTGGNFLGNYSGTSLQGFVVQGQDATGCLTIQFISNSQNNAGNWQFSASASCATPCSPPVAGGVIVGGATTDSIAICVGDVVTFQEQGSFAQPGFNLTSYDWDFFDGNSSPGTAGGTVQHQFNAPGHYTVNLTVTDDNSFFTCTNTNLTQLNVFVANPPTFYEFPNDTSLCIGESIDIIAQPQLYDSTWNGFPFTSTSNTGCLMDQLGVAQAQPIDVMGYPAGSTITGAADIQSICIDMEHSYMGDLVIQIQCPGNVGTVTLHQQGGGGTQIGVPNQADNVQCDPNGVNPPQNVGTTWTYCFTPTANETWVDWVSNNGWGQTLPAGDYAPVQSLDGLAGCDINGQWNIIVIDNWGADDGYVAGWSINFTNASPNVVVFTPQVGDNADSSYWDNSGSFITNIAPDGNTATVTPTVAGSYQYSYSVIDDFGCTNDSSLTITVDPQIFQTAGLDTSVCNGEIVQLGPNVAQCNNDGGNYTYCYNDNENTTFTYCPDNPGDGLTYMSISFNSGSTETFFDDITVYDGQDATAPVIGTYEGDLSGLVFTATNPTGCITMVLSSDGSVSCSSGSQTPWDYDVSCGSGNNLTYQWTPDDGSLDDVTIPNPTVINPTTTTTYTLAVYPVGHPQCVTTDDVVVSIGGGLDAGTDSTKLFCFEGPPEDLYTYLGGTPQLGGQWYNPAGQAISMPIQPDTISAGLYEYRRDSSGCTASAFIDVSITQIDVSAIVNNSDCNAFNGEVQLLSSNTLGSVQFSNDNGITFQNSDTFIGGMGSGNTYSFLIQDSVGCIATIDTIVIDDNFPVIDVASIVTIDSDCSADNGQVTTVTTNGGTPNYTYSVDGITVGFNALPLTNLPPSTPNTFDLIVQDNFGCQDTAQITINEINTPLINSIDVTQISCYTVDDAQIIIDGVNLQSYSIDGGVTNQNSNTFTGLAPGTYDIVVYSGVNGTLCSVTDQVVINTLTPLQIDTLSADITVCPGDEITLGVLGSGGNGNYTYDWDYLGNSLGQGTTISVVADFAMQVCVTMSEDCPSPTTTQCMNITTAPDIYPALMASNTEGCYPVEVDFTNITNNPMVQSTDWIFSDNGTTITAQGINPVNYVFENPGVFNVDMVITSVDGCVYDTTYSQLITVYDHPDANFVSTPNPLTIYETEAHFIDYSGGDPVEWQWNFGSGAIPLTSNEQNPKVVYPQGIAAIYPVSLYITNEFGCVDSLISQVQVNNDVIVYAPNVFTPDNDEFNQTWRVYISGIDIYEYHLILFNRWGEIIWESYNPDAVWKGNYGTDAVQDGTYVWVLNAKDSYNDKKYEFRGTVSVLR
jgi:gliding motility-associated-like protein